jgi:hypothetical protein
MLHAFTEVSMVSISVLHPNVSLNSLYCRLFLCRGPTRVLDDWRFAATASELSMWVIPFHHRLPPQVVHRVQTAMEKPLYKLFGLLTCPRRRAMTAPMWMHTSTRPCFDSISTNIFTTYLNCHLFQHRTKLLTLFHS